MSGTRFYEDPYVMCPFYCKEAAIEIRCSGVVSEHSTQTFHDKRDKLKYKASHCNRMGGFGQCPLYKLLVQQYDEAHRG